MEVFYRIVAMLGGLAMFLYGMRIMGDGLKSSSGGAMKTVLAKLTSNSLLSFLFGLVMTCAIQSSTATIVLTVGLVGAEFITFRQSVGIVLGANVGTAITAQIIRLMDVQADAGSFIYFFKSDNLAPLALIIGIILIMFVKKRSSSTAGTIFIGFGVLFIGLMNMSNAVTEMGDALSNLLTKFEGNYVLGFLSGTVVTAVIQSSSAVVGILQSVASSVGVSFCGVFAVIIGVNIGDCLTTYLVCRIGAKPEQRRTCLVHILYNIFAAVLVIAVIAILRGTGVLNDDIWYYSMKSGGVANIHGLFRLVPAVVSIPLIGVFSRLAEKIVPLRPEDDEDNAIKENLRKLDPRLISNPGLAFNETGILLENMCDTAIHNYDAAIDQLFNYDPKRNDRIKQREDLLDEVADATEKYIVSVSPYITRATDERMQTFQLRAVVVFERIGDLANNISETVVTMHEAGRSFSPVGNRQLKVAITAVRDILTLMSEAFKTDNQSLAARVEPLEEVIDELVETVQAGHTYRMTHGQCDVLNGLYFQNILLNLERISDQCSDIGVYLLGKHDASISGSEHQYLHNLHHSNDEAYLAEFGRYHDEYFGQLGAPAEDMEESEDDGTQISLSLDNV